MRILVLTSNSLRHRYFVECLNTRGYNVLAWGEEKGENFNNSNFNNGDEILLKLHSTQLKRSLRFAIGNNFKDVNIHLFKRGSFRDNSLIDKISKYNPNLIITYGCGIIGKPIMKKFKNKIIGSHQGLPQYYRGSGSNFFAFINGDCSKMGVSVHLLDDGIDTGPVISQLAPKPEISDTYYSFSAQLICLTFNLFINQIEKIKIDNNQPSATPLNTKGTLFQRHHFTPHLLNKMFRMQMEKSFHQWYIESLKKNKPPVLIN